MLSLIDLQNWVCSVTGSPLLSPFAPRMDDLSPSERRQSFVILGSKTVHAVVLRVAKFPHSLAERGRIESRAYLFVRYCVGVAQQVVGNGFHGDFVPGGGPVNVEPITLTLARSGGTAQFGRDMQALKPPLIQKIAECAVVRVLLFNVSRAQMLPAANVLQMHAIAEGNVDLEQP